MTLCGHPPMPWQELATVATCGRQGDGSWVHPQASTIVARQQGKTDLVAARILASARFWGERVLYTTHSIQASVDLWRRVTAWVDSTPLLARRVRHILRSNGRERLEFAGGGVLQITTVRGKVPRGFDRVAFLVVDEARELLTHAPVEALGPTQAAALHSARWYLSNAGSRASVVLNALRDEGRELAATGAASPRLWQEWSAPADCGLEDLDGLRQANPAIGFTVTEDYLLAQRPPTMTEAGYRTEHLCQWVDAMDTVIPAGAWSPLVELADTVPPADAALGYDVDPDRGAAAIAAAWARPDGHLVVALLDHHATAGWLADQVARRAESWPLVATDALGPAVDVTDALTRAGVKVQGLGSAEVTAACPSLVQAVTDEVLHHRHAPALDAAVGLGGRRPVGDRWVWRRAAAAGSLAPLTAATWALWAYQHRPPPSVAPAVFAG